MHSAVTVEDNCVFLLVVAVLPAAFLAFHLPFCSWLSAH